MSQLRELARPFPASQIERKPPRNEEFVAHHVVEQRLISVLGRVPNQQITKEIYDGDKLTGVRLRMWTEIDGVPTEVEEPGAANGNESTNGDALKNAVSDAYKRCAMRMTLGLHLWAQEHYWLDAWFEKQGQANGREAV